MKKLTFFVFIILLLFYILDLCTTFEHEIHTLDIIIIITCKILTMYFNQSDYFEITNLKYFE